MTTPQPVEEALAAAVSTGDEAAAVDALAGENLVLPQTEVSDDASQLTLPVIEHDNASYVPVFTSAVRMAQSLPDVGGSIEIPAVELARVWPSDDLWLAVNPGDASTGIALPATAMRVLATR